MLRSGGGAIVNNSSVGGHIGFPGSSVYVASKFAVIGLTKTAALEFARQGIRVNSVSPGPIQTEMFDRAFGEGETEMKKTIATQTPVGRIGTPEEIASAVLWLSSPGAAFITGQDITVDGDTLPNRDACTPICPISSKINTLKSDYRRRSPPHLYEGP
jgi:NAD(P)-dependent dehydrogenase (short-subunit alcohol dehydrogenase family)